MTTIHSLPNPFSDLSSPVDLKAEERNAICRKVALAVSCLGIFVAIGGGAAAIAAAIHSATIIVIAGSAIAGMGVITAIVAYKSFKFIRDIDDRVKGLSFSGGRLHKAAAAGQVMMTRFLLFLGANPNKKMDGDNTPLHMACFEVKNPGSKDHIKVMDLLVRAGANVNAKGNWGRCPLHFALEARHVDRVKFLVEKGAFINLKQSCNPDHSPWEYAEGAKGQEFICRGIAGDPRKDKELLEADKSIYEILREKGSVYTP